MLRNFVRPAGSAGRGAKVRRERSRPEQQDVQAIEQAAARLPVPSEPAIADWFTNYRAKQTGRLAFDLGLVRDATPAGGVVVDLGAVPPILSGALAGLGYVVHPVDIAPERFADAFAALDLEPLACDLELGAVPLPDAVADTVVLHEVFEHLRRDPIHLLEQVARILKPCGALLLSTPNLLSLNGVANLVLLGRAQTVGTDPWLEYGKLRTLGHMGHVREYTPLEVCEFLARFDLRTEAIVFRGRSRGAKGWLTRAVPPLRPFFEVVARKG
jgi:SAM-dependent methyltransferase